MRDVEFDGLRGYAPDVEVPLTLEDLRSGRDAALEKALEILEGAEPPARRPGSAGFTTSSEAG